MVAAHLSVLDRLDQAEIWGRPYFITSGKPVRLWSWLAHILSWKALPHISKAVSLPVAVRMGRALERVYRTLKLRGEPPLTEFSALQLGCSHTYSIEQARELLGYNPQVDPYDDFTVQFEPEK